MTEPDDPAVDEMMRDWHARVAMNCQAAAKIMCKERCGTLPPSTGHPCGCRAGGDTWRSYMDLATALFRATMLNMSVGPE